MILFTSTLLLLCSWISVSVSEFHTEEVKPGDEATLMCSNFTSFPSHIHWYKMGNKPNASHISSMIGANSNVTLHDGYDNKKFIMTSNMTNILLSIKDVNFSDSGLYFCGFYKDGYPVIYDGTYLHVQNASVHVPTVIFGCLTVFLLMVVVSLIVRIRTLHKAQTERQSPRHSQNLDTDALNYAALSFPLRANRTRTSERETQMDPHVLYAATR